LLDQLDNHGLSENTIVFFFSDHGRPFPRAKNGLYDSGLRIPFILHIPSAFPAPPGYQPGGRDSRLLSGVDIAATSLNLAGIDLPDTMQGRPFFGRHLGEDRDFVVSCLDRIGGTDFKSRTIRTRDYRLTWNLHRDFSPNSASTAYRKEMHPIYHVLELMDETGQLNPRQKTLVTRLPEFELYDLRNDPFETLNLAGQSSTSGIQAKLFRELRDWIEETGDRGMREDSPQVKTAFANYRKNSHASRRTAILEARRAVQIELEESGEL
jgi:N-sulfoglucosamine sulfohydrolase